MPICPRVTGSGPLQTLLAASPRMDFAQAWRKSPDEDFRPASVRIGWRPDGLLVLAELFDADIFNPCTKLNELSFQQGDVFELFLRPLPEDPYYEMHVTPHNQHLQLRFPSQAAFLANAGKPIPPEWFITQRHFATRVKIEADRWYVEAEIAPNFFDRDEFRDGDEWLMSFSRYDYVRGRKDPIYSSTSPHAVLSYHRQQEWARVRLS